MRVAFFGPESCDDGHYEFAENVIRRIAKKELIVMIGDRFGFDEIVAELVIKYNLPGIQYGVNYQPNNSGWFHPEGLTSLRTTFVSLGSKKRANDKSAFFAQTEEERDLFMIDLATFIIVAQPCPEHVIEQVEKINQRNPVVGGKTAKRLMIQELEPVME